MAENRKTNRYGVRRDGKGWTVFEVWSGEPVVLAQARQIGLSELDAQHTAELMNRRATTGDSSMRS